MPAGEYPIFVDERPSVWLGAIPDSHGAAWADFDRDGDLDLIEMVGGGGTNQLMVNISELGVIHAQLADFNGDRIPEVVYHGFGMYPGKVYDTADPFFVDIRLTLGIPSQPATPDDTDGDDVTGSEDNCVNVSNTGQRDTDGDGYGNRCDPDLNNDCVVNVIDPGIFRSRFFSSDPDADFDSNREPIPGPPLPNISRFCQNGVDCGEYPCTAIANTEEKS